MKIENILQSLKRKVECGEITIRSAAYSLYNAGWYNYVPNDREVINTLRIIV